MTGTLACLATLVTIAVLVTYEVVLIVAQRVVADCDVPVLLVK